MPDASAAALGVPPSLRRAESWHVRRSRATTVIGEAEESHRFVLLVADSDDAAHRARGPGYVSPWQRLCCSQADLVLCVGQGVGEEAKAEREAQLSAVEEVCVFGGAGEDDGLAHGTTDSGRLARGPDSDFGRAVDRIGRTAVQAAAQGVRLAASVLHVPGPAASSLGPEGSSLWRSSGLSGASHGGYASGSAGSPRRQSHGK